jgi:hypothetical protein
MNKASLAEPYRHPRPLPSDDQLGGQLGGFGGGLLRKQHLLDLERGDRLL